MTTAAETDARTRLDGPEAGGDWLLYDGECPFCSRYVRYVRLRQAVGPLRLIDARRPGPERRLVEAAGLRIDEGMVLHLGGQLYHGADCMNRLALLSTSSGIFNGLNAAIFRSPAVSRLLYPILRAGRNATLKLLGRRMIDTA